MPVARPPPPPHPVGPWRSRRQPRSRRSCVLSPVLRFWRARPARDPPSLPASLPSRLLRPIVLPGRPPFLVSPFSSPLGWTCDSQCFSVTSPSGWKMCSFDRWVFPLLNISVDTWARGIRRSGD